MDFWTRASLIINYYAIELIFLLFERYTECSRKHLAPSAGLYHIMYVLCLSNSFEREYHYVLKILKACDVYTTRSP